MKLKVVINKAKERVAERSGIGKRKKIDWEELLQVLKDICETSITSDSSWDLELGQKFMLEHEFKDHIEVEYKRPRIRDKNISPGRNNIVFKNLDIKKITDSFLNEYFDNCTLVHYGRIYFGLRFEGCHFDLDLNGLILPFAGNYSFYRNKFKYRDSGIIGQWLFCFGAGSKIFFEKNDFDDNSVQIACDFKYFDKHLVKRKMTWQYVEARCLDDSAYYEAMIRKTHDLPDSVPLLLTNTGYSRHFGFDEIRFVGNRRIDNLSLRASGEYTFFNGINRIKELNLDDEYTHSINENVKFYFGLREKINPRFSNPLRHRQLFLTLKNFAVKKQDTDLQRAMDVQLNQIEHHLVKEQWRSIHFWEIGKWIKHFQDRVLWFWRKWSADYYRSWLRPLVWGIVVYFSFIAFSLFFVGDWSLRDFLRLSRHGYNFFFVADLLSNENKISFSFDKCLLYFFDLCRLVLVGMLGFSIRRVISKKG